MPYHSQTMDMAMTIMLFAEMAELQWHYDHVIDFLYMTATYRLCLYIFFCRDFAVPPFSPLFDPLSPFLVIPLYMAHPIRPPTAPPQPAYLASSESDPSQMVDSTFSSSSAADDDYAPADFGMVNRFLSSEFV